VGICRIDPDRNSASSANHVDQPFSIALSRISICAQPPKQDKNHKNCKNTSRPRIHAACSINLFLIYIVRFLLLKPSCLRQTWSFSHVQEDRMDTFDKRLGEHNQLTRRCFFQLSAAAAAWSVSPFPAANAETNPQLQEAIAKLEYLTPLDRAFILDKGNGVEF
jgi:hypothetical protein